MGLFEHLVHLNLLVVYLFPMLQQIIHTHVVLLVIYIYIYIHVYIYI